MNAPDTSDNQIMHTPHTFSAPHVSWFLRKGYPQGAFWATMLCVVSVCNDVLMRFLGERLHPVEIVYFRFLFSTLAVLPLMLRKGTTLFKTTQMPMHAMRAVIGAVALGFTCYSVTVMPLAENTTILFAIPLFFLPMAHFFLKEKVGLNRWLATIVGFAGLMIVLEPGTDAFTLSALFPVTAALLFAVLNVMAKKMVVREDSLTLLFYFGLGTTLITGFLLPFVWKAPNLNEIMLLILLGIGANLIQVCLYISYKATEASSITAFSYTEIIFSSILGYLFFAQVPPAHIYYGAAFIIAAALYVSLSESKEKAN